MHQITVYFLRVMICIIVKTLPRSFQEILLDKAVAPILFLKNGVMNVDGDSIFDRKQVCQYRVSA